MIEYILTALAGIALGVVGMRVWASIQNPSPTQDTETHDDPGPDSAADKAHQNDNPALRGRRPTTQYLMLGAGVIFAAGIAVYAWRGSNGADANPRILNGAAASITANSQNLDDVDSMIGRLAARLREQPNDGEGQRMLGWSYVMTDRPQLAIEPYKKALALIPENALVHSGYGEALVAIAKHTVTAEAKASFTKAISLDPAEPRSKYFLALWKAQNGEEKSALEEWIKLANSEPADAPWQSDLRHEIDRLAAKLGENISDRLKAAPSVAAASTGADLPAVDPSVMQAASKMPKSEQDAMISGMVDGLAAKLKANPKDPDGWIRLLRSRMVLGQAEQAKQDLIIARKGLANDPAGLRTLEMAASALQVPSN